MARTNKTNIKNAALALVGEKTTAANTVRAKLVDSLYDIAKDEIFELPINWRFATARDTLTAHADEPEHGQYDYQYVLPSDCARVIAQVDADNDNKEFEHRIETLVSVSGGKETEQTVLLSDEDECYLKYIRYCDDVSRWPAYFKRLVILNLAIYICEPLKQDKQKKNQLIVMFEEAKKAAEEANGMLDTDTDSNYINYDKGNTDVVDAATVSEADKNYIIER